MTLTTWDEGLCKKLEPNVSTTKERLEVLHIMKENGIPTVVWLCPFLPYINDDEENFTQLLDACIDAGVHAIMCFGIGVTMRDGNREYFYEQLNKHFPKMKQKYMRIFGDAYECHSPNHKKLMGILRKKCKAHGIMTGVDKIFTYLSTYESKEEDEQMSLF